MHVWTQVVTKWSWYTPAYSPFFDSRSLRKLVPILFWTWPTKHVNHWRTLLLAQDPLPNSPRILFRARPDHLLSLPRVPFNAPTGSSSESKNPSGWIICMLTDLLPSNNMLQTLVSQDQLRLQDWLRTSPYNSLSIYRECRLMVRPHEGPFRSHWNKNVGIFNCTRGCQNDNAWCESTDEQVVTLMTFPFQWA